jgi:hypothetical protein
MSDHLGVCVRSKARTGPLELIAQFTMVFDDAVMDHSNAIDRVRMGVLLVRAAMSCPARVANSYEAGKRLTSKLALKVLEFSDRAPPGKETALERGNTG